MVAEKLVSLSPDQHAAVQALSDAATAHDAVAPLNESARFALRGLGTHVVDHWLATDGETLVGYGQVDPGDASAQLVVHPDHRRRGHGRRLADAMRASGTVATWWAFGNLPGAQGLAGALGLSVVRGLNFMTLGPDVVAPAARPLPDGLVLDHFRPGDLDEFVRVNAAAFAHHPEQGAMTAADFRARMDEDWYRDDDLLIARDASTGGIAGYHWTKLTSPQTDSAAGAGEFVGEVYVLGVSPAHAGHGVGSALLAAGILHMRARGASTIELYVEADNDHALALYRRAGFEVASADVAYGSATTAQPS
ncbi:mycothiol synthase [Brooklawnia cerclae]